MLSRRRHELPPTAGMPLRFGDLLPGRATLAAEVAAQQRMPPLLLTCSGSAALMIALATLHEQHPLRRRVVMPAYTCPLVALAVHQAGLEPVPCDLRPDHFDMDPQALRAACDERTLAILPTHLGGRVADVDDALAVANNVGAFVIEDAAQALGARARDGASVGLAGDLGFFSLAAGKGLSTYEGGLLAARDPELRERLAHTAARIAPYKLGWELRRSAELLGYAALYRPHGLALAYGTPLRRALRDGDAVAAVGDDFALPLPLHALGRWRQSVGAHAARRLPAFLDDCAARAARHLSRLRAIPGLTMLDDPQGAHGTWPFFLLLLPSQRQRDAALAELWQTGLGVTRLFIHALPDYAYLEGIVPQTDVPNARDFAARSLTIGNSQWLTDADMDAICLVLENMLMPL